MRNQKVSLVNPTNVESFLNGFLSMLKWTLRKPCILSSSQFDTLFNNFVKIVLFFHCVSLTKFPRRCLERKEYGRSRFYFRRRGQNLIACFEIIFSYNTVVFFSGIIDFGYCYNKLCSIVGFTSFIYSPSVDFEHFLY